MQEELIFRAKNGDNVAMEQIFESYKGLARSVVNKFFVDGEDKEDLLQEAMIGVFGAVTAYDENKGSFGSFVKICVTRKVFVAFNKAHGGKRLAISAVDLEELSATAEEGNGPHEKLIAKELAQLANDMIKKDFTPLEKGVFTLHVKGYNFDEIGSILGKSRKAVDGAMQRARKKLQFVKEAF